MIWNADTAYPSSVAADMATSIWAPYGMMPWNTHENVSRIDAVLRLRDAVGLSPSPAAMGFAMTMATVLFAVAMSMAPTSRPMPS